MLSAPAGITQHTTISVINELHGTPETGAHLLEFDTVHGRWARQIDHDSSSITVDGQQIAYSNVSTPAEMDLRGVDIVIDATRCLSHP